MKLSRLPMVLQMALERDRLLGQLDSLDKRELCVTIASERQDDTILEMVRPVINCEVRARICEIDRDLVAQGVEID